MENMEQMVKDVMESSKDSIKESLNNQIKDKIISQLGWSLDSHISEITKEYIEDEMTEEIKALLSNNRQVMLDEIEKGLASIGALVAKSMYQVALNNLELNSYSSKDIIKKIFS